MAGKVPISKQLQTARCVLRYPLLDDAPRMLSAFTHPDFPRRLPLGQIKHLDQVHSWIQYTQAAWDDNSTYAWAVEQRDPLRLLGQVTLARLPEAGTWALAFWLHPDCWGQGFASEAAERGVMFAFEELAAAKVWAGAGVWNQASQHLLEKLGMTWVGDNPAGYQINNQPIPTCEYALERAEWVGFDLATRADR